LVRYSDEDDSAKGYDENPDDSESLTEKPSDVSSTESTESDDQDQREEDEQQQSSLVNHYANVNSTFRHSQTWRRNQQRGAAAAAAVAAPTPPKNAPNSRESGNPQQNPRGYSSFTDSDHGDASSAVVSLNGTQIVMNNIARSRAPIPGFSSFV